MSTSMQYAGVNRVTTSARHNHHITSKSAVPRLTIPAECLTPTVGVRLCFGMAWHAHWHAHLHDPQYAPYLVPSSA